MEKIYRCKHIKFFCICQKYVRPVHSIHMKNDFLNIAIFNYTQNIVCVYSNICCFGTIKHHTDRYEAGIPKKKFIRFARYVI